MGETAIARRAAEAKRAGGRIAMTTYLGEGPCRQGHTNDNVLLTGERHRAANGGTWWQVAPGQACGICGQELGWMYEAPIVLEMPCRVTIRESVEVQL